MAIMQDKPSLGVAIVGCGTVGAATAKLLCRDRDLLANRIGRPVELKYIVDINFDYARKMGLNEQLFCKDIETALTDESVDIVVELVGGTTIAKEITEKSLRAGKSVVTANKALLAIAGPELYALAREHGVAMGFEASCVGGVPVISALTGGLIANRIDALFGIINGTCNYILSQMTALGQRYNEALAEAQADGLAEADPTLDVGGGDSAHKLAILSSLAFGVNVDFDKIPLSGIDTLDLRDIEFGQQLGYIVKLLAIAERQDDGLSLCVRPAFIPLEHPLAWVSGPFNAVSIYGHAVGHAMFYGRGAGGSATASAVLSDIAGLATGSTQTNFKRLGIWPDENAPANQLPPDAIFSRFYLRVTCQNSPGVLAKIADTLGRHSISIQSVLQHEAADGDQSVPVIITTERAVQGNINKAIAEIDAMDCITAPTISIPIIEEYPEELE